jgi:hypothetical protein
MLNDPATNRLPQPTKCVRLGLMIRVDGRVWRSLYWADASGIPDLRVHQ